MCYGDIGPKIIARETEARLSGASASSGARVRFPRLVFSLFAILGIAAAGGCVPIPQRSVAVTPAPAPAAQPQRPRIEPAVAVNQLYEHTFAEAIAGRIARACPTIAVNSGAVAEGARRANEAAQAARLSAGEVQSRLSSTRDSRLSGDFSAFTAQTGIVYSDEGSVCEVGRKQIVGGSRIGSYLVRTGAVEPPPEPLTVPMDEPVAGAEQLFGDPPPGASADQAVPPLPDATRPSDPAPEARTDDAPVEETDT